MHLRHRIGSEEVGGKSIGVSVGRRKISVRRCSQLLICVVTLCLCYVLVYSRFYPKLVKLHTSKSAKKVKADKTQWDFEDAEMSKLASEMEGLIKEFEEAEDDVSSSIARHSMLKSQDEQQPKQPEKTESEDTTVDEDDLKSIAENDAAAESDTVSNNVEEVTEVSAELTSSEVGDSKQKETNVKVDEESLDEQESSAGTDLPSSDVDDTEVDEVSDTEEASNELEDIPEAPVNETIDDEVGVAMSTSEQENVVASENGEEDIAIAEAESSLDESAVENVEQGKEDLRIEASANDTTAETPNDQLEDNNNNQEEEEVDMESSDSEENGEAPSANTVELQDDKLASSEETSAKEDPESHLDDDPDFASLGESILDEAVAELSAVTTEFLGQPLKNISSESVSDSAEVAHNSEYGASDETTDDNELNEVETESNESETQEVTEISDSESSSVKSKCYSRSLKYKTKCLKQAGCYWRSKSKTIGSFCISNKPVSDCSVYHSKTSCRKRINCAYSDKCEEREMPVIEESPVSADTSADGVVVQERNPFDGLVLDSGGVESFPWKTVEFPAKESPSSVPAVSEFDWKRTKQLSCNLHDECMDSEPLAKLFGDYTWKDLGSYDKLQCCKANPHLKIMIHAVSDFFRSVGFGEWYIDDSALRGMVKHKGKLTPWNNVASISAMIDSRPKKAFSITRYISTMMKFNRAMKYRPYVMRVCATHKGSDDSKIRCIYSSKMPSKDSQVRYFMISHMDHDETGPLLKVVPQKVGICVKGNTAPTAWISPVVDCPHLFYDVVVKCPKNAEAYLDVTDKNWRKQLSQRGPCDDCHFTEAVQKVHEVCETESEAFQASTNVTKTRKRKKKLKKSSPSVDI